MFHNVKSYLSFKCSIGNENFKMKRNERCFARCSAIKMMKEVKL